MNDFVYFLGVPLAGAALFAAAHDRWSMTPTRFLGYGLVLLVAFSGFDSLRSTSSWTRGLGVVVMMCVPFSLMTGGFALAQAAKTRTMQELLYVVLGTALYLLGTVLGITIAVRLGLAQL